MFSWVVVTSFSFSTCAGQVVMDMVSLFSGADRSGAARCWRVTATRHAPSALAVDFGST